MNFISYQNKICIVTGSASGIGYEVAKLLQQDGAIVYGLDLHRTPIEGVKSILCDLSNKESIDTAFSSLPIRFDYFFGVANTSGAKHDFYKTFTINFIANKYITDNHIKDRIHSNGAICYASSILGRNWDKYSNEFQKYMKKNTWEDMIKLLHKQIPNGTSSFMAYPLSQRAINFYMASEVNEFADRGVRINAVLPSSTEQEETKDEMKTLKEMIPQQGVANRYATDEEVAKAMLFLNSDMASYISGVTLPVDYGNEALIKTGKKRDILDIKVGSKLFNIGIVQSQLQKTSNNKEKNQVQKPDSEEIEIL